MKRGGGGRAARADGDAGGLLPRQGVQPADPLRPVVPLREPAGTQHRPHPRPAGRDQVEGDVLRVRPPGREHAGAGAEDRGAGSRGRQPRDVPARHRAAHAGGTARSTWRGRRRRWRRPSGQTVRGFRAGEIWNDPDDLWILDLIAEAGYQYDSSFCPWMRRAKDRPDLLLTHRRTRG